MDSILTTFRDPAPLPADFLDQQDYEAAVAEVERILGPDPTPHDAVIHGVTVRLHTNNTHWRRFWAANWFAPQQWATLTGSTPPADPQVRLYATTSGADTLPWSGYSSGHNTAFMRGDTPYAPLRALALGAVGRYLAEEEAVHYVPGLCVVEKGRGRLWLSPPGQISATSITKLLARADVRLVALDGVFIRYGLVRMVDGVSLLPTAVIEEKGDVIPGYRLFPWLEEYGHLEPRADARCLTLEGEETYCFSRDLDLWRAPEAFAFPLEQSWYIPTRIVAVQPDLAGILWRAGLENVPPLTSELLDRFGAWAEQVAPVVGSLSEEKGHEEVLQILCRLRAAPHGRAMVTPDALWPGRAGSHPWRPFRVHRASLLDNADSTALTEILTGTDANLRLLTDHKVASILTQMLTRATQHN